MRVAVAGKEGAGKSVIAGTVARLLAQRDDQVLALDSETLPGLSLSLGAGLGPADPPLVAAGERRADNWWHLKRGIGPVRAVERYATMAPDGVRLLQSGKVTPGGLAPAPAAVWAFNEVAGHSRNRVAPRQPLAGMSQRP